MSVKSILGVAALAGAGWALLSMLSSLEPGMSGRSTARNAAKSEFSVIAVQPGGISAPHTPTVAPTPTDAVQKSAAPQTVEAADKCYQDRRCTEERLGEARKTGLTLLTYAREHEDAIVSVLLGREPRIPDKKRSDIRDEIDSLERFAEGSANIHWGFVAQTARALERYRHDIRKCYLVARTAQHFLWDVLRKMGGQESRALHHDVVDFYFNITDCERALNVSTRDTTLRQMAKMFINDCSTDNHSYCGIIRTRKAELDAIHSVADSDYQKYPTGYVPRKAK